MEITAEKVNVDLERGTVILTGVDLGELLAQFKTEDILAELDQADIDDWQAGVELEKQELELLALDRREG